MIPIRIQLGPRCKCALCATLTPYETEVPGRGAEGQVPCCERCSEEREAWQLPAKADYEAVKGVPK